MSSHATQCQKTLTEGQFEAAMEHAAIGTALVAVDGRWLWSNKALRTLLGYEADELKSLTFQDLTHPDDLDADLGHVAALLQGRAPGYQMEKRYLRKGGGYVTSQLSVSLVRTAAGAPDYFISQIQDITDRKANEADREALTERLTLATRAGGIGVWEWDVPSGALIWDAAMLGLYELGADQVSLEAFFGSVHPQDVDRLRAELGRALAGEQTFDTEFRILGSRGEIRDLRALATVLLDEDGRPGRMIGTNWDITEKRRLIEKAEAGSEAKSLFLASMSHEIRTPLNGVLGMAQALANGPLSASQRESLRVIEDSGQALLSILNDILDLTKVEAGKLELESIPFDLGALLHGVQDTFTAIAQEKDVDLQLSLGDAGGVYRGDPTRVRQVVANLVSNALKFTSAGYVRLDARLDSGGLDLTVSDTGIGVPEDLQERIFAVFSQADVSTTRAFGGTGLGLSICKQLTELMGGSILLKSRTGAGAAFTVSLPLERMAAERPSPGADRAPPTLPAGQAKVLVAEDNATNQLVLKAMLSHAGIHPHFVGDGQAAVEAWEREAWDVILMDVRMPVLDGISATRSIRRAEARSGRGRTYIIALTANAMAQHVEEYAEADMDDFVPKPIEVRTLFAALERARRRAPIAQSREQVA
jgi:PAS domain S-box-containing protein